MSPPENDTTEHPVPKDPDSAARRDAAGALEELLECATDYDSAAGASTDAEEWFGGESQSLLYWAKERGRFLSPVEFGFLVEGFKWLEGGLEHQVLFKKRSGRVFKITKPPHFGHTWYLKDYVQNVIWCNSVFEDDMRLEGVIDRPDGVSLVISQPYIHGRSPTEAEIEEWFAIQSCVRLGKNRWRYPDGMVVSDAHAGNLIFTSAGHVIPIDLHIDCLGERRI